MNKVENTRSTHDEELIEQFGEMVRACEKYAREASLPWKLTTGVLTLTLAAVLLWYKC